MFFRLCMLNSFIPYREFITLIQALALYHENLIADMHCERFFRPHLLLHKHLFLSFPHRHVHRIAAPVFAGGWGSVMCAWWYNCERGRGERRERKRGRGSEGEEARERKRGRGSEGE